MFKKIGRLIHKPGTWDFSYVQQDSNESIIQRCFSENRKLPNTYNYIISANINVREDSVSFYVIDPIHAKYQNIKLEYNKESVNKKEDICKIIKGMFSNFPVIYSDNALSYLMIPKEFFKSEILSMDVEKSINGMPEITINCILNKLSTFISNDLVISNNEDPIKENLVVNDKKCIHIMSIPITVNSFDLNMLNENDFRLYDDWSKLIDGVKYITNQLGQRISKIEYHINMFNMKTKAAVINSIDNNKEVEE